MQNFALVRDAVVVEIITVPDELVIGVDIYTADFAAGLIVAGEGVEVGMTYDGEAFGPPPAPPAPDKASLAAYAAAKRWQIENGGITVAGAEIKTTQESQARITGAYAFAKDNPSEPIDFLSASGWVNLTSAEMIAIGQAAGVHVQTCFRISCAVDAAIDAGTITSFAAIDAAAWPA
ncbi:DUF4376 domain-containing protein [Mesorhizobium sp. BR1-1-16]|uniref:DUF4376 domain-containing protein n=1 Tax=Mesorhizobium sp. BR1-1-16 TaxID=2876653 RepID=UPI001CCDBD02|nr:DUF4376 domain-containing protein [Mesorhizobium sp. BR1-1-16]MBZ9939122.1 DUF4376 domain-containing protein [Mesorhizobium sp. BR1-1-16]